MLTPAQFSELQRQVLIFEHMKAGLPVPCHVLIPISKEVASSFGSDRSGIYNLYPSRFRPLGKVGRKVDHRIMMDQEPGRCRRTDGNKWRCSKNAVPDQKYCERRMYRGCTHSRKHVEASQIANVLDTNSPKDSENLKAISIHSPQSLLPLALKPSCDSKNSKTTRTLSQPMIPSPVLSPSPVSKMKTKTTQCLWEKVAATMVEAATTLLSPLMLPTTAPPQASLLTPPIVIATMMLLTA